jgi:hypothetical protein
MASKKYGSYEDYKNNLLNDKIFLFQLHKKRQFPSLVRSNGQPMVFPARAEFKMEDEIYDSKLGRRRQIRYALGVKSIFVDEQNQEVDSKRKAVRVEFKDGLAFAKGNDPLAVKFLMMSNYNGANPDRDTSKRIIFEFVDKDSQFREAIDNEKKEWEAVNWVYSDKTPLHDLTSYARVLIGQSIEDMKIDEIRWNLKAIAKSNPSKFMAGMTDPRLKRKQVVYEAIDKGLLGVNYANNTVFWKENPTMPLTVAPIGVDPIDQFVQASFTPDGEIIFKAVREQVAPVAKNAAMLSTFIPEPKKEVEVIEPQLNVNPVMWTELKSMYDKAIEKGIIVKAASWIKYGDYKLQGTDDLFIKTLKGDKALFERLSKDLAE